MTLSLKTLVESFLAWGKNFLSAGTCGNYRRILGRFATHLGDVQAGDLKAHSLMCWAVYL